jgi:hypothetical protein
MPIRKADDSEKALAKSVSAVELKAESLAIETDEDYESAGVFGREIKGATAEVQSFFKPMKEAAHRANAEICAREKQMLDPLKSAEKTLKLTMGAYVATKEQKRRAMEAELRRRAQEEADRLAAEAAKLESQGDVVGAAATFADAQVTEAAGANMSVVIERPAAAGVSTSRDWEVISIDPASVPISVSNIEIRPVDKAAVIRLIRATKGSVQIPGVTFKEVARMSFRR